MTYASGHWTRHAQVLAMVAAGGLLVQGALTTMSVLASQLFFENFAAWQSVFLGAELVPALVLLVFLRERPSNYMHQIAPAA